MTPARVTKFVTKPMNRERAMRIEPPDAGPRPGQRRGVPQPTQIPRVVATEARGG